MAGLDRPACLFRDAHMSEFAGHDLYCRRGEREVFARLAFTVGSGEALVLRGPNGSGKSSLLRCMAALLRPLGGAILWDGRRISDDPEAHRRRLHFLGHQDAIKPVLSVEENLAFWSEIRGTDSHSPEAAAELRAGALAQFAIEDLAKLPARLLSAGQRRRLALARLVASPAPLWLLDEPTAALDEPSVARFETAVAAHRARGGSVVLAAHGSLDLPDARTLALSDFAPSAERNPDADEPES